MTRVFGMEKRSGEGLGEKHYNDHGLNLSNREGAHGRKDGRLQWKEGHAFYKPKKEITAEGMLQTAGPSGTTLRMMGAYKLLGASKEELLHFRLALIAWMTSSKDHSLYEILVGSRNAGVVGREDLTEAAKMYQTIDPLTIDEIRDLSPKKELPHETIYKDIIENYRKKNPAVISQINNDRLHGAGDKALNMYTTENYSVMNVSTNQGERKGKKIAAIKLRQNLGRAVTKEETTEFYNVMRLTARMSEDSLNERAMHESDVKEMQSIHDYDDLYYSKKPEEKEVAQKIREVHANPNKAYRGITYRGGRFDKYMKSGSFTTRKLTSTSQSMYAAGKFYGELESVRPEDKAIFRFEMDGKSGVNISALSVFDAEEEVLIPVGAKFQVQKVEKDVCLDFATNKIYSVEEAEKNGLLQKIEMDPKCLMSMRGQVVHVKEISGPGENERNKQKKSRQQNENYRKLLADRKNRAAM